MFYRPFFVRFHGFVINIPLPFLSPRESISVCLAAAYAAGKKHLVPSILRIGLNHPTVTRECLAEVCVHLSLLLGFPTMLDGLEQLSLLSSKPPDFNRSRRHQQGTMLIRGKRSFSKIYGRQAARVLANLGKLHAELPQWIIRDTYGRVFSRPGLSLRERELINVVILAFQRMQRQLQSHLRGAIRVGLSTKEVRSALKYVQHLTGRNLSGSLELMRTLSNRERTRP